MLMFKAVKLLLLGYGLLIMLFYPCMHDTGIYKLDLFFSKALEPSNKIWSTNWNRLCDLAVQA